MENLSQTKSLLKILKKILNNFLSLKNKNKSLLKAKVE